MKISKSNVSGSFQINTNFYSRFYVHLFHAFSLHRTDCNDALWIFFRLSYCIVIDSFLLFFQGKLLLLYRGPLCSIVKWQRRIVISDRKLQSNNRQSAASPIKFNNNQAANNHSSPPIYCKVRLLIPFRPTRYSCPLTILAYESNAMVKYSLFGSKIGRTESGMKKGWKCCIT